MLAPRETTATNGVADTVTSSEACLSGICDRHGPACGIAEPPQALAGGTDGRRRPSSRRYSGKAVARFA